MRGAGLEGRRPLSCGRRAGSSWRRRSPELPGGRRRALPAAERRAAHRRWGLRVPRPQLGRAYAAAAVTVLEPPAPSLSPSSPSARCRRPEPGGRPGVPDGAPVPVGAAGAELVLECQVGGLPRPRSTGRRMDGAGRSVGQQPLLLEPGRAGAGLALRIWQLGCRLESDLRVPRPQRAHGHARAGALLQSPAARNPPEDPDEAPRPWWSRSSARPRPSG